MWDTGAQVSLVYTNWLNKHFPELKLRPITELTEGGFDIKSASGTGIPILGWVPLKFKLPSKEESDQITLIIPFLVSDTAGLDRPILGFNVIVELISGNPLATVISQLRCAMINVPSNKVKVLSECLSKELSEQICTVKTGKVKNVLPPVSTSVLKVSVHSAITEGSMTAVFVPKIESACPDGIELHETVVKLKSGSTCQINLLISNHTNHQVLGYLETVKSVTEIPVEIPEDKQDSEGIKVDSVGLDKQGLGPSKSPGMSKYSSDFPSCKIDMTETCFQNDIEKGAGASEGNSTRVNGESISDEWEPQVELGGCGLTEEQILRVRLVLREEHAAFAKDADDIGTVPDLELNIRLTDNVPVKHSYMSIPRPLYDEVKDYLKG